MHGPKVTETGNPRSTSRQFHLKALTAICLATMALTGCGVAGIGSTTGAVRIVNAVQSPNNIDFSVEGGGFIANTKFKDVSTYGYVGTGSADLVGYSAGTNTVTVPTSTVSLNPGVYTIVASGVAGSTTASAPVFTLYPDDNSIPPAGRIRVRVINASPDAGAVSVALGKQSVASGLVYRTATSYTSLPSGSYTVTATSAIGNTTLNLPTSLTLNSGHVYTFFIEGTIANNTFTVVPQLDV